MYVKPAPGVLLRDPVTKQLLSSAPVDGVKTTVVPDAGMLVDDNDLYWRRRLRDGDAVRASTTQADTASKATATEKTLS
ncbi:DUF2635 domain-containing protein [Paraburkholderia sp. Ac-20340]|uniref:DUF2635 domain-containing protein n=1 Tax=Paraburkholderia sp. Ac-20340 TaxID=2703888 RepID=UPI001980CD3D|nr:DUF2635 domain-containing protein [Paraburkholderia sp. Ac-20340]MBN3852007.1 DUF2635 domain-containing protein [Paraburkholderia sp. Ac-20340]